jgi:hypothetical protein
VKGEGVLLVLTESVRGTASSFDIEHLGGLLDHLPEGSFSLAVPKGGLVLGINKITKRIFHSPDVVHHSAKLVPLHGVVPVCVYLSNHLGKGVSGDPLTKVVKDRLELLGINVAVAVHIKGLKCTALDGGGKE